MSAPYAPYRETSALHLWASTPSTEHLLMTHFTAEQIAAAKNNDIEAITALIAETEHLVTGKARELSTSSDGIDHDLFDDLAQVGRIRVWECLSKFAEGENPREFMSYIDKALFTAMSEHRRTIHRPGVTERTARDFELAVTLAAGDPYDAVRIACTKAMGLRKMTRDRAYAALLSWLGTDSLDRPYNAHDFGEEFTLGDVIAAESGVPADLLDTHDYAATRSKTVRDHVHRTLGLLSDRQRHVLKADHGIAPVPLYGDMPDAALADDMGATPYQVKQARVKGKARFAALYTAGAAA